MATASGVVAGTFPALTGAAAGTLPAQGAVVGTFPALTGDVDGYVIEIEGDASGTFPALSGAAEGFSWVRTYGWGLQIWLDSVDITALVIGVPVVEAGESQSALADIVYHPAAHAGDIRGQPVEIKIYIGGFYETIHSGVVISSAFDLVTGFYRLQSSNEIQEHFRAMADDAAVLAALPGAVYSDAVFGENEDRWKWAQDALLTIPAECHLDTAGELVVTDWAAKADADHILSGDDIFNVTTNAYRERDRDDQVNRVVISYGYGYQRWKSRQHSYSYHLSYNSPGNPTDFCDWYKCAGSDCFELPIIDTVRSAITNSGWPVAYEQYDGVPLAADCSGTLWDLNDEDGIETQRVLGATVRLFKNFTQPIGEDATITVESAESISRYGTVTRTRSAGRDIPADNETWSDDSGYQSGWLVDNIGDAFDDQDDEMIRANDIQCAMQAANVQIWERHRNSMTIIVDINPSFTLDDTVELSGVVLRSGTLACKGKISNLKYVLDLRKPRLEMTLAITRGAAGTGVTLTPPSRPTTDQVHAAPASSTLLINHVGNRLDSASYTGVGGDWTGWLTNTPQAYTPPNIPSADQIYPEEFRVATVGVEDDAVNELAVTQTASYNVAIPDDPFSIT